MTPGFTCRGEDAAGKTTEVKAGGRDSAAGGFQANAENARALPWARLGARQGARHALQHGDVIRMALAIVRRRWATGRAANAVAWERNAPEFGDLAVGDQFQKHSYPWGIYINAEGKRFVDEGADFRNYTYAKYGRVILFQPGQFAWQIFDPR